MKTTSRIVLIVVLACLTAFAAHSYLAESTDKKNTAVASLLVAWQEPHILPRQNANDSGLAEFECFRATQMQLIKSRDVVMAALRNPKLKSLPTVLHEDMRHNAVGWLTDAIHVRCPDERAGLLTVSITGNNPEEAAALVNAVVEAYKDEVVNRDRKLRRERLDTLQKISGEKEAEVRSRRETLKRELEAISGSPTALETRLLTEHALFCQHKLDELRNDRLRSARELQKRQAAGGDVKEVASQLAWLTEDINLCQIDFERTVREVKATELTSVAAEMARKDVDNVEKVLQEVTEERERLRVELNAPLQVQILGDEAAPARVPDKPDE